VTTLPIPSGPTNREIIDRAYQVLGVSDAMFGRTDEEYASAIIPLSGMMFEYPYSALGYIYEDEAGLRVEEESGIPRANMEAVAYGLAERIAPTIGKSLSPEAVKAGARLFSALHALVATIESQDLADGTPAGAGNRMLGRTYFNTCDTVADIGTLS
jgi:hypothetical protein